MLRSTMKFKNFDHSQFNFLCTDIQNCGGHFFTAWLIYMLTLIKLYRADRSGLPHANCIRLRVCPLSCGTSGANILSTKSLCEKTIAVSPGMLFEWMGYSFFAKIKIEVHRVTGICRVSKISNLFRSNFKNRLENMHVGYTDWTA